MPEKEGFFPLRVQSQASKGPHPAVNPRADVRCAGLRAVAAGSGRRALVASLNERAAGLRSDVGGSEQKKNTL